MVATALALLGDFDLDRPVRLLGVRLELSMPDMATGEATVGAGS